MNRERVDQLLVVILRRQSDLRCVRVLKHMMTEFVSEIEAASPGLQRAVDDCHAQISDRNVRGIPARPAEVEREREQTSALRECLKAKQRSLLHTELSPQLHSGTLGCLNGRRRIQRNPRDLWDFALVDQKVDIASDPLNPRIKHPRPPTDCWVRPSTHYRFRRGAEEPIHRPVECFGEHHELRRGEFPGACLDLRDHGSAEPRGRGYLLLCQPGKFARLGDSAAQLHCARL